MKVKLLWLLILLSLCLPALAAASEGNEMANSPDLTKREQCVIPIAAFTASGEMDRLEPALNEGLESGLTINEIKEVLLHLYAYAGFPRSLNGLSAFMAVLDERKDKGMEDVEGPGASPVPPDLDRDAYGANVRARLAGLDKDISGARWQRFSPVMDALLKEHLFADIFVRDVLSHQDRELVTIAALANLGGTEGQLRFHLGAAMNTGLTKAQMREFVAVLDAKVGKSKAESARALLEEVLAERAAD